MSLTERIKIAISSHAKLEGLNEASKAVQALGKAGKRGKEAIGEISGAVSQMGEDVGDAMRHVNNMAKSIEAFGCAGILIGGVKVAFDMWATKAKESAEETLRLANEMEKVAKSKLDAAVARHVGEVHDAIAALADGAQKARGDFERVEASAAKVAQLMGRITSAQGRGTLAEIQVEKLNAIIAAETETAKKVVEAQYNLRLAREKATQAENEQTAAIKAATKHVENREQSLRYAEKATQEAETALALSTRKLQEARDSGLTAEQGLTKFESEVAAATSALAKARLDEEKATYDVTESKTALALAEAEAAASRKQSDVDLLSATEALTDAERSAAEAIRKQAEAARKEAEEAENKRLAEAEKAEAEATKKRNAEALAENIAFGEQEIRERGALQENMLAAELAELNARLKAANDSAARSRAGMAADGRVSDFGPAYDYDLDANGNINDFVDWQRAQRFGGRAARDAATANRVNAAQEKRAADLQKKLDEGKRLGENEQKFLYDWNRFNDERNRVNLEKQAAELQKKIEENTKKMAKELKAIRGNLKTALEVQ